MEIYLLEVFFHIVYTTLYIHYNTIQYWLTMVAIQQLKASKLIVYFVSFTDVIFTILTIQYTIYIIHSIKI